MLGGGSLGVQPLFLFNVAAAYFFILFSYRKSLESFKFCKLLILLVYLVGDASFELATPAV